MQQVDTDTPIEPDNLIVFDEACVLRTSFFQFMLRHDRHQRFQFATAQSPLSQRLYRGLRLPTEVFETNLVIVEGRVHPRLDAFAAMMRALPGCWPTLSLCRFLPGWINQLLCHLISPNRFALFGRTKTCVVPGAAARARFVAGGF